MKRRALLKDDHPHAGKAGELIEVNAVGGELVAKIRLDGAYEGECYAFPGQWTPTR
jgi:hypothetical protein